MSDLNKRDVEKIVQDEIKKFIKNDFEKELGDLLKKSNGKGRKEVLEIVKDGIAKFTEFLYVRRSVWQNDIR